MLRWRSSFWSTAIGASERGELSKDLQQERPVSGLAGAAEDRRPDSAAALGAGRPVGEHAWSESRRRSARSRLPQIEEAVRGGGQRPRGLHRPRAISVVAKSHPGLRGTLEVAQLGASIANRRKARPQPLVDCHQTLSTMTFTKFLSFSRSCLGDRWAFRKRQTPENARSFACLMTLVPP